MKILLIAMINFYQRYLSFEGGFFTVFALGKVCKYDISCSEYTKQKIESLGVGKGIISGIQRIWSCK